MNVYTSCFRRRFLGRWMAVCALCATPAGVALGQEADDQEDLPVRATEYGTVTLAVQDTDLAQVLEMLSIQTQKNIITSKNVAATISANLYDVTFHEALDAILKVNGYDYVEEGNFIYIYTQDELEEIERLQRQTESRIFELDHLTASDAHELIAPLLSEIGRSSFRGDVDPGINVDAGNSGGADWAYNAKLVVSDYPENLDNIAGLLTELDAPPLQVLVEATILQTALDEENAFGIDFSVLGSVDFTDLTSPLAGVNNLLAGDDEANGFQPEDNSAGIGTSSVGNTAGPAGLKIGIMGNDLSIFLKLLDEVTDSTVLAKPKIMCLNRQRAEILVGARVGYLSTTATETSTTQSVDFLDTGIQLMFRPFISRNGMIRMELQPSVSEASLRTVTDAQGLQVTIPDELTNELTTNVRLHDGETLVLGGLFRESVRTTRRQVPFFGDIPLLGAAFRGHDDVVNRNEIMFLITPSIVHDESLWAMGGDAMDYTESVQVGARQGLLPFSREKTTNNYNNRAIEAFNRGDLDKANYYINNSLRLNSNQPAIRRLRERVLGIRERPYNRSLMDRVVRSELGELIPPGDVEVHEVGANQPLEIEQWDITQMFFDPATGEVDADTAASDAGRDSDAYESSDFWQEQWADDSPATAPADDSTAWEEDERSTEPMSAEADVEPQAFGPGTDQEFIDRFIHEYFKAIGLAHLSPYPEQAVSEAEADMFPFTTFDEMPEMDLVEAAQQAQPE